MTVAIVLLCLYGDGVGALATSHVALVLIPIFVVGACLLPRLGLTVVACITAGRERRQHLSALEAAAPDVNKLLMDKTRQMEAIVKKLDPAVVRFLPAIQSMGYSSIYEITAFNFSEMAGFVARVNAFMSKAYQSLELGELIQRLATHRPHSSQTIQLRILHAQGEFDLDVPPNLFVEEVACHCLQQLFLTADMVTIEAEYKKNTLTFGGDPLVSADSSAPCTLADMGVEDSSQLSLLECKPSEEQTARLRRVVQQLEAPQFGPFTAGHAWALRSTLAEQQALGVAGSAHLDVAAVDNMGSTRLASDPDDDLVRVQSYQAEMKPSTP